MSDAVVNNSIVRAVDKEVSDVISRLYQTASVTVTGKKKEAQKRSVSFSVIPVIHVSFWCN